MSKFSDLAAASATAQSNTEIAQAAFASAEAAEAPARAAVVAALKTQAPPTAALVDASGVIKVFSLTPAGDDYTVTPVPGDFDVPDAPPADA